jgi:predicted phage-related endonuclease
MLSSVDGRVVISDSEHFTVETYRDRAAWLDARMTGYGGSDAPGLWGFGYKREYALWTEKRGLVPSEENDSEYLRFGVRMEQVIADEYAYQTGRTLVDPGRTTILRSRRWPWMFVSIDRVILDKYDVLRPGILEAKNRGVGAASAWRSGVPDDTMTQLQHAFAVTGMTWGSAAAAIGGNHLEWIDVEPIPKFIEEHVDVCRVAWERVQSGEEPPATGHDSDGRAVRLLFPEESGETIALDSETAEQIAALETARAEEAAAKNRKKAAENLIRQRMGSASYATLPDGRIAQLLVEPHRAEEKPRAATNPRVLRIKKSKGEPR